MEFNAVTIAGFLKGVVEGNPETVVNNVSKIEEGFPGALSFLANPKYEHYLYTTKSSIVLVNKSFVPSGMWKLLLSGLKMHMTRSLHCSAR
jgi:UDP-3-O-[3-hydroxymyristoyl] glucosamine N-acyltransferase